MAIEHACPVAMKEYFTDLISELKLLSPNLGDGSIANVPCVTIVDKEISKSTRIIQERESNDLHQNSSFRIGLILMVLLLSALHFLSFWYMYRLQRQIELLTVKMMALSQVSNAMHGQHHTEL